MALRCVGEPHTNCDCLGETRNNARFLALSVPPSSTAENDIPNELFR